MARLDETLASWEFQPGMGFLLDVRSATHHMSGQDMARMARYLIENRGLVEGGRAAIVVTQTVTYGMMRMLQAHVDTLPFQLSVFYDLDEALSWLGLDTPGAWGDGA